MTADLAAMLDALPEEFFEKYADLVYPGWRRSALPWEPRELQKTIPMSGHLWPPTQKTLWKMIEGLVSLTRYAGGFRMRLLYVDEDGSEREIWWSAFRNEAVCTLLEAWGHQHGYKWDAEKGWVKG